jgi:phosphoribosylglycinamide formyltransferase 1
MTRIAVLASGRGSNFEALVRAVRDGRLDAEIVALVSDRPQAPALEIARTAGIPALAVAPESTGELTERRRRHDERVLEAIAPFAPRFLVMAGYMRIVTPTLIEAFRSERGYARITNIHPSLLPSFPGVESYGQAWKYGAKVAGVTVHLVEESVDSGPVLAQEAFAIADCPDAEAVERRGLAIEHRLYPETLGWALRESFEIEHREGRPCVLPR